MMILLIVAIKLVATAILAGIAFGFLIADRSNSLALSSLRGTGHKIDGKVTESRVVENRKCNSLPGYHFTIGYEFQLNGKRFSGKYSPTWRYRRKSDCVEMTKSWPVGTTIAVTYDSEDPSFMICELDSPKDLVYFRVAIAMSLLAALLLWTI